MSRDLSLNKIAPHLTSPSIQGMDKANPVQEFSPYVVDAEEKFSEKDEQEKRESKSHTGKEKSAFAKRYPEIFKLIEIPDFAELFQLAVGKEDARLLVIIKNIREKRGVTALLPVSDKKETGVKETHTYQHTAKWFTTEKGHQFCGKM